jgi:acyl CoA:acetate/3-ketoacid CoA transferase alpha subunit
MIMIDALTFALAAVAMGIPAIITAATLGSKMKLDW